MNLPNSFIKFKGIFLFIVLSIKVPFNREKKKSQLLKYIVLIKDRKRIFLIFLQKKLHFNPWVKNNKPKINNSNLLNFDKNVNKKNWYKIDTEPTIILEYQNLTFFI